MNKALRLTLKISGALAAGAPMATGLYFLQPKGKSKQTEQTPSAAPEIEDRKGSDEAPAPVVEKAQENKDSQAPENKGSETEKAQEAGLWSWVSWGYNKVTGLVK